MARARTRTPAQLAADLRILVPLRRLPLKIKEIAAIVGRSFDTVRGDIARIDVEGGELVNPRIKQRREQMLKQARSGQLEGVDQELQARIVALFDGSLTSPVTIKEAPTVHAKGRSRVHIVHCTAEDLLGLEYLVEALGSSVIQERMNRITHDIAFIRKQLEAGATIVVQRKNGVIIPIVLE